MIRGKLTGKGRPKRANAASSDLEIPGLCYQAEPQAFAGAINRRREAAGVECHPRDTEQGRQLRNVSQATHQSQVR